MWGTVREPHALLLLIFQICQGGGGGGQEHPLEIHRGYGRFAEEPEAKAATRAMQEEFWKSRQVARP